MTLTDDLDGTKADRTIRFSFDGLNYEIELSKKNANAMHKALTPYISAARKVRSTGSGRAASGSTRNGRGTSRTDLAQVREWAQGQGIAVSGRGRVSQNVVEQYDAAH